MAETIGEKAQRFKSVIQKFKALAAEKNITILLPSAPAPVNSWLSLPIVHDEIDTALPTRFIKDDNFFGSMAYGKSNFAHTFVSGYWDRIQSQSRIHRNRPEPFGHRFSIALTFDTFVPRDTVRRLKKITEAMLHPELPAVRTRTQNKRPRQRTIPMFERVRHADFDELKFAGKLRPDLLKEGRATPTEVWLQRALGIVKPLVVAEGTITLFAGKASESIFVAEGQYSTAKFDDVDMEGMKEEIVVVSGRKNGKTMFGTRRFEQAMREYCVLDTEATFDFQRLKSMSGLTVPLDVETEYGAKWST